MATTPSHITMLREISAAGDRERTGALDVEWEGAHATLFFMFGHPSHVVFETADGRKLVGEPALDAIVEEMPTDFRVAPWRRAMVTDDTLRCSAEDLMGLFQRRNAVVESNGKASEPPEAAAASPPETVAPPADEPVTTPATAADPPPAPAATSPLPFGLADFPLLPMATTLWTDAAANVANLEAAVPRLPDSFIVLSGPTSQGVALVTAGRVSDAMWVNAATGTIGDEAAHSVMTSLEGTLTAYQIDDPRVAAALPMLWRAPRLGSGVPGGWLHTDDVVAEVRTSVRSCGLLVDSADPGVALFVAGELVAVYTDEHRWPATSMAALRTLLHQPGARVTVLDGVDIAPTTPDEPEAAPAVDPTSSETAAADAPEAVAETADAPEAVADTADAPQVVAEAADAPEATADIEAAAPQDTAEVAMDETTAEESSVKDDDEPGPVADEAVTFAVIDGAVTDEPSGAIEAATAVAEAPTEVQPRGRGRRGRARQEADVTEAPAEATADLRVAATEAPVAEPDAEAAVATLEADTADAAAEVEAETDTVAEAHADSEVQVEDAAVDDFQFEPAVFTIADLPEETPVDASGMSGVEAREATEFVPARLDIDIDSLRAELTEIATVWLGEDDAAPVARAITNARAGVDDFVSTIRSIGSMEIPGHETAVVRAMAREMHFRATEVLTGV